MYSPPHFQSPSVVPLLLHHTPMLQMHLLKSMDIKGKKGRCRYGTPTFSFTFSLIGRPLKLFIREDEWTKAWEEAAAMAALSLTDGGNWVKGYIPSTQVIWKDKVFSRGMCQYQCASTNAKPVCRVSKQTTTLGGKKLTIPIATVGADTHTHPLHIYLSLSSREFLLHHLPLLFRRGFLQYHAIIVPLVEHFSFVFLFSLFPWFHLS